MFVKTGTDTVYQNKQASSRLADRIALASAVMGAGLWWARAALPELGASNILMDFGWLLLVTGMGALLYAGAATLLRAYDLADIGRAFSKSAPKA